MTPSPSEDKTCRMCGYADQSNLNIFQTRQIYKKILALYPIVLYKSDPLPKNICLKCYSSTLKRYDEYLRISKSQTKWINNVRTNQPNNPYIKVLDKIEITNKNLIENLRKIGDDSLDDSFSVMKYSRNHFPEDISSSPSNNNSLHHSGARSDKGNFGQTFSNQSSNRILLSHLKGGNLTNNLKSRPNELCANKIKNSLNPLALDYSKFPKNKCRYCSKVLPNQKYLAFHQVKFHLNLTIYKSFTKKRLPKRFRCGQAVKIDNKINLRCNNCWKCFDSHDSILNHWHNKRCHYFCFICGKEYPTEPSLLIKHIKVQHLLQFKAYKNLIVKSHNYKLSTDSRAQQNEILLPQQNEIFPKHSDTEENACLLTDITDFRIDSFEFINIKEKPKIPVLKLKRKTNSERDEFDIKIEEESCSPPYIGSPNDSNTISDIFDKPLLRVKDISELQQKPAEDDEFMSLDEFNLNKLNMENENPDIVKETFSEEM